MTAPQPGILSPIPTHSRYMEFRALAGGDPRRALADVAVGDNLVIGLGPNLVEGLRPFPALTGPGCEVPSTQTDLWCWLRGEDRGDILHASRALTHHLASAFHCERVVDGFKYGIGRDLTGYEDGTENPEGADAVTAALAADGSSYVAVQTWVHDLDHFESLPQSERDHVIGRRLSDNEELDDAPKSAHVKRAAQESFDPEAFMVRRSMPWAEADGEGLVFVAFGHSLDAYEAVLRRMVGEEDGVTDALFRFSHPITGGYFWCPPVKDERLSIP